MNDLQREVEAASDRLPEGWWIELAAVHREGKAFDADETEARLYLGEEWHCTRVAGTWREALAWMERDAPALIRQHGEDLERRAAAKETAMATSRTKKAKAGPAPAEVCEEEPGRDSIGILEGAPLAVLDVAAIDVEAAANHRLPRPDDALEISRLTASLRDNGQISPVLVHQNAKPGRYVLDVGYRRVRAAQAAGLPVLARVLGRAPTPEEAERLRAAENLDRVNPTPVEEAILVQKVVDQTVMQRPEWRETDPAAGEFLTDDGRVITTAVVEHAASVLGRSPTWVRDRLALARLSGQARDLVLAGTLPLGHAREIAKLADPNLRDDLAKRAAGLGHRGQAEDRRSAWSLRDVKNYVERHRSSLMVVPWRLDVAFAGKPACTACPSNSANARGLFEGDREAPPADRAVCLNQGCFKAKTSAANQAIKTAAARVLPRVKPAKKGGEAEISATPRALEQYCPAAVKPVTFAGRVRREAGLGAKPAARVEKAPGGAPEPAKVQARRLFEEAEEKWRDVAIAVIVEAVTKDAGLRLLLQVGARYRTVIAAGVDRERIKPKAKAAYLRIFSADIPLEVAVGLLAPFLDKPIAGRLPWSMDDILELNTPLLYALCAQIAKERLGRPVFPAPPVEADFVAAAKAPVPAKKNRPAKKPAKAAGPA